VQSPEGQKPFFAAARRSVAVGADQAAACRDEYRLQEHTG
jgi:hypothetical protein